MVDATIMVVTPINALNWPDSMHQEEIVCAAAAPLNISPLPLKDWPAQLRDTYSAAVVAHELVDQRTADRVYNDMIATLARHPQLAVTFARLMGVLTPRGLLPARDREMVILRTAYLSRSTYEWSHHHPLAKIAGLSEADIDRLGTEPIAPDWSTRDQLLLTAVDEIHHGSAVSDDTGRRLSEHYPPQQLLELIFLTGCYRMVSTLLHSCRIAIEPGVKAVPWPTSTSETRL
jgi:4-carboxymuconolactone decarboxylase